MKFDIIVCDPPWSFGDTLKAMKTNVKRSAVSQYPTMTLKEIQDIDVASIKNDNSLLVMWVPSTLIKDGISVIESWGFVLKQTFIWVKTKKNAMSLETDLNLMTRVGMGRIFRQSHEIALVCTTGSVYKLLKNKSQRSVAFDLNEKHSSKPETLQDRLDLMFPNTKKLEMFGRRKRHDWTVIGNEIDGLDIKKAIQLLQTL